MRDPRTEGLAKILVGYSTEVKQGEVVSIDGESAAAPLLLAVYEEVLKAGANPVLNVALDGQIAAYFKHASDAQLEWISPFAEWMVDNADVRIASEVMHGQADLFQVICALNARGRLAHLLHGGQQQAN